MNLVELVGMFHNPKSIDDYFEKHYPKLDLYTIILYLEEKLSIDSTIHFFDADLEEGLEFNLNGKKLISLLPLSLMEDLIEDFERDITIDIKMAERLIQYVINDA